jgi:hypothetical protein
MAIFSQSDNFLGVPPRALVAFESPGNWAAFALCIVFARAHCLSVHELVVDAGGHIVVMIHTRITVTLVVPEANVQRLLVVNIDWVDRVLALLVCNLKGHTVQGKSKSA